MCVFSENDILKAEIRSHEQIRKRLNEKINELEIELKQTRDQLEQAKSNAEEVC